MKAAPSDNRTIAFAPHRAMAAIAIAVLGLLAASDLRAEVPAEDLKAAGAVPLTTELLDKLDKFMKAVNTDDAAKAELAPVNKDESLTAETWGTVVSAKCPKTVEILKVSGLTPHEFATAIYAILIVTGEDLSNSEDQTVKANLAFVAANEVRTEDTLTAYLRFAAPES
jgi:hypothetical protein